jgi:MerR family glutamine synthetase transcriptional repressor
MPVFPIGTVMKLTDLSARQIRYYEDQGLIDPARSEGNRRLYSMIDIDRLLEIRDFLDEGLNMAGIKHVFEEREAKLLEEQIELTQTMTDAEVRRILREELMAQHLHQGKSTQFDKDFNLR